MDTQKIQEMTGHAMHTVIEGNPVEVGTDSRQ